MFFIMQSNDSFNFLLGWIKYIVVVTWQPISILKLSVHAYLTELIPTLRFSMYTIHILAWESWFLLWHSQCTLSWECWFPLWDSQCRQLLERADFHFEILTAYSFESLDFHFWDSQCRQLLERADFHFEILTAYLLENVDFHFEIHSADNYLRVLISTLRFSVQTFTWKADFHFEILKAQLLGDLISTLRFSMHNYLESWFPLWDSQCTQYTHLLERVDFHFEILCRDSLFLGSLQCLTHFTVESWKPTSMQVSTWVQL